MPCDTRLSPGQTLAQRMKEVEGALRRLEISLGSGSVRINIAPNGAITFVGWKDRDSITDVCAYRTLSAQNSWQLRQAVARAESLGGRKVNANAIAQGFHSHDGGRTWSKH